MLHEIRLFFLALQFLTRIPIPKWVGFEPDWLAASLRYFCPVGTLLGLLASLVFMIAKNFWPLNVAVILMLLLLIWLTGAFHEDGLADTCDALGGMVSRDQALLIMKDSRIGTYGAVALILALSLKIAVLCALACAYQEQGQVSLLLGALIWSQTASRAAPIFIIWSLPYAGDSAQAKAKPLVTQTSAAGLYVTLAWLTLLASGLYWSGMATSFALLASVVAGLTMTLGCRRWQFNRLQGFTGDTLGATQQLVELSLLLFWLFTVTLNAKG